MAYTTCCTWIDTSGDVEIQLRKITAQATRLKRMIPSIGSFFDLLDFDCLGSWGPQTWDDPAWNNHSSHPGALDSLKSVQCMFAAANHRANDVPKTETSEKNKKNNQLIKLAAGASESQGCPREPSNVILGGGWNSQPKLSRGGRVRLTAATRGALVLVPSPQEGRWVRPLPALPLMWLIPEVDVAVAWRAGHPAPAGFPSTDMEGRPHHAVL